MDLPFELVILISSGLSCKSSSAPGRSYQTLLVEGFDILKAKIFHFADDNKAVIVYAIYWKKGSNIMPDKHALRLYFVIMPLLVLAGCIQADPVSNATEITLPTIPSDNDRPVIDGVLQPGEWDQADFHYFVDGSELYLLYGDNHLYLAIKAISPEMITANVFFSREEGIHILHTSAALGTAIYHPEGDSWRKTKDFEWCCRSRIDNGSARAVREDFYQAEKWMGINSFHGNENELEYMISLSGSEEYLAVNFLRTDHLEDKYVWPVGIDDGPAQPTIGGFPEMMDFSPENWFNLKELP